MNNTKLYPVFVALVVALGGFLLGFDGVVNGGAVPFYRVTFGISNQPFLIGLSSSAIIFGAMMGNFSVGFLIDKIGRKPTLMLTSILFMIGAAGTALAPSILPFILFKLIAGLGVGVAILAAPMYIAEIAPPKKRGWLVTFNQLNIVVGLSIAMISNYYILNHVADPDTNWRWMLGVGLFPACVYFVLLFLVPESPRWLIQNGREAEGIKVLQKACGAEAQTEFDNIKKAIHENEKKEDPSYREVFGKSMRYVLFLGIGLAIFQQFSGINAVLYYAPMIFESAGSQLDAAFLMAIVVGLVFTASTVVSMFLIDRLGRRPLLIIGCSIMALSFFVVTYAFHVGSYSVPPDKVESLSQLAYQSEVEQQAKLKYPDSYLFDDFHEESTELVLMKDGEEIGRLEKTLPGLKTAKKDADLLRNVLMVKVGRSFPSENEFFSQIKGALMAQYERNDRERIGSKYAEIYKPAILKSSISIDSHLVLLGILGFITGFSISLGPVMWAMFSEIFPTRLRAKAISVVGGINGIASFTVATIFPMQLEYLGSASTYMMFGGCMLLCLVFVWRYIPETKGKTLEELEGELIKEAA